MTDYMSAIGASVFSVCLILLIISWSVIYSKTKTDKQKAPWKTVSYICYAILIIILAPKGVYFIGGLNF